MAKRGRPSAASIAVARPTTERQPRADAPYDLPDEAADVWHATLEALPAGWIGSEAEPILAAYCRTTVSLRRIGQLIHGCEHGPGDLVLGEYALLLREHARQAQVLKTLGTSLRLTPQSRLRAEGAARRVDGHHKGPKPWERPE